MRLTKQLAEAIARALKLRSEGREEESKQSLTDVCAQVLGVEHRVLNMLDAASAVALLGEKSRVEAYAQLLDAMGDASRASELRALASA